MLQLHHGGTARPEAAGLERRAAGRHTLTRAAAPPDPRQRQGFRIGALQAAAAGKGRPGRLAGRQEAAPKEAEAEGQEDQAWRGHEKGAEAVQAQGACERW